MALLQRSCFSRCTTSAGTVTFTAPLPQRAPVQMQAPKSHRVSLRRASSEDESSSHVLPQEAAPTIFKDESNGIICYYDETGDVTCEGWDEGPHFQPDLQQPSLRRRRRFTPRGVQGRGDGETVSFKNIQGRMGESLREVANESLECSELNLRTAWWILVKNFTSRSKKAQSGQKSGKRLHLHQASMIEDKNVLTGQVKKLMCQVSKLDEFKKALMKISLETSGDDASKGNLTLEKRSPEPPPGATKSVGSHGASGASEDGVSSKQSPLGPLAPCTPPDSSPVAGKSPRIDGKEFFRQARNRLTDEQFSGFLSNVKELNAYRREKELKAAQFATHSMFHPKIYTCNTHTPPNYGDWVLTSSKIAS